MGYCPGFESVQKGFTSRSLIKTRLLTKYMIVVFFKPGGLGICGGVTVFFFSASERWSS